MATEVTEDTEPKNISENSQDSNNQDSNNQDSNNQDSNKKE
jgi:hypothetical protein